MEHLRHFGLSEDPFRSEPLARHMFEARQQRDAMRRLERGVRQGRGLCALVGDVGSGKTMVVRQLLESLEEEVFEAAMLVVLHGAADASWLLTRFAKQLGIEEPPREREALLAALYERLAIVHEEGRHAVLIIDDAHAVAAPGTLAEICGLLKLEYEDRRLLSLVLAGSPHLDATFSAEPILAQRIEVRVALAPFDRETVSAYLAHRIQAAGGCAEILDAGAVAALHELGRGVPGLVNTLADNALFEAFLCGRDRVERTDVERAHGDLAWGRPENVSTVSDAGGRVRVASEAASAAPVPVEDALADSLTGAAFSDAAHGGAAPLRGNGAALAAGAEQTQPDLLPLEDEALDDLDSELEAVFDAGTAGSGSPPAAGGSPPKEDRLFEDEADELFVELLEED